MDSTAPAPQAQRLFDRALTSLYGPWGLALAGIIILFGAPLTSSFWLDETITAWLTALDFKSMLQDSLQYQSHSPLTFALFWVWQRLFGVSEWSLRLPALLSAAATLYYIYKIGSLLVDREVGLWAALLLLCHESFLKSAMSARPYCFALLFAVGSVYYLLNWIESRGRRALIVCLAQLLLAFYSHYFFIGIGLIHAAFIVSHRDRIGLFKSYLIGLLPMLLLAIPGLLHFARLTSRQGLYHFSGTPSFIELCSAICPAVLLLYVLFAGLLAAVLAPAQRGTLGEQGLRSQFFAFAGVLVLWAVLPPAIFFLQSKISGGTLFFWRFYLWAAPGTALLLGLSLRCLEPRRARSLAFCCILVFIAIVPRRWSVEDWRGAAALVNHELSERPDTAVLAYSGLIELENPEWLREPERLPYLLSPFQVYPLHSKPVVIPSGFFLPAAAAYLREIITPILDSKPSVLLISSHMNQFASPDGSGAMPEYFVSLAEERGFKAAYLMKTGSVWVILLSRTYAS